MRLRLTFSKTPAMRYTGHLDLHKTWERTFRRAGLPLAYSQGFNPRPKLNLASALPLGFTSDFEVLDAYLEEPMPLDEIARRLAAASPPGIQIHEVREIDRRLPAPQTELEAAEYILTFLDPLPDLDRRLEQILAAGTIPRVRRGKEYDLRPLIHHLERLPDDQAGRPRLLARLAAREGATGRPDELAEALGADSLAVRIHRSALIFTT